ncbi:MAG: Hsp70 family protein [Candidatus Methanomethylophilaceae archaeon]|nr:Hsp70 family protein [Candidatus Methanomethylophilaceae archaeon]
MVQRVGIDLGTTYSAVTAMVNGKPVVIRNAYGNELTPSVVCFYKDSILVGEEASEMMAAGVGECVTAFKRYMGTTDPIVSYNGVDYTSEDLSTIMLKHLVDEASKTMGRTITDAVITVPQYFTEAMRQSTLNAGTACGINVLQIINEPTSAALYYGYNYSEHKTLMVYDLGGGTFDVNIISYDKGTTTVMATKGDHYLGGKNWDEALMNLACTQFMEEFEADPRDDPKANSMMMSTAERVKRLLSTSSVAPFVIEYKNYTGRYQISRESFRAATEHLMKKTLDICNDVRNDAGMEWEEIDEILLIGGSSRMPMVKEYLARNTGRPIVHHPDMELAVSKGACIASSPLMKGNNQTGISETILHDVTAHSLGALAVADGQDKYINKIMIPRNSGIPCKFTNPFRIKENSWTEMIEVYALQGESENPEDCTIISRSVITGFPNKGTGVDVDITYSYNLNGTVSITAEHKGKPLDVRTTPLPDDMSWISRKPSERKDVNETVRKCIAVCLDVSYSMREDRKTKKCPLDEAKKSIKAFVDGFDDSENNLYSLIVYSQKSTVDCEPTSSKDAFKAAVDRAKLNQNGRGTEAVPIDMARSLTERPGYMGIIIIQTDGRWEKNMNEAIRQSRECRDAGIPIFALGFGDADRGFLNQIATVDNGGLYTTVENLGKTFDTIATAIKEDHMNLRTKD